MPRIATVTWARNEADILEVFVRHHSQIVDHMVIILHATDDNSSAILEALKWSDIYVEYYKENRPDHAQEEVVSAHCNRLLEEGYDLVMPLDADEFICSDTETSPREILDALPLHVVHTLPWKTYVPTPSDNSSEPNPLLRITMRREREPTTFSKVIVPKQWKNGADITLSPGSHHASRDGNVAPAQPVPHLYLAHFPVRSELQIRRKIVQGMTAIKGKKSRLQSEAFHWEQLLKYCTRTSSFSPSELSKIALYYACQDSTKAVTLEYSPMPVLPNTTMNFVPQAATVPAPAVPIDPQMQTVPYYLPCQKNITPAIIISHPRSGSTNFCAVLNQHPDIVCSGELFNFHTKWMQRYFQRDLQLPIRYPFDYAQHLKDCYEAMHNWQGKRVCCSKVFFNQVPQPYLEHWLLHADTRIILLKRTNLLAAALSVKIAEQTGIYNLVPGKQRPTPQPFAINIPELKTWLHTELWWLHHCRTVLKAHGKPYLELTYEKLSPETLSQATSFLAGSPLQVYEDKYVKITTAKDYASITNLDEVLQACRDPMYGSRPI